MQPALIVALYRCEVDGKPSGLLDVQVRYFEEWPDDPEMVLKFEPTHSYSNDSGQTVTWPFVRILAIEEWRNPKTGDEVVGFISSIHELKTWSRLP